MEILDCMALLLLRHSGIEGKTERMLTDPYELKHVADPDFQEGLVRWQVTAAEPGTVSAAKFAGYGDLQGRYPNSNLDRIDGPVSELAKETWALILALSKGNRPCGGAS